MSARDALPGSVETHVGRCRLGDDAMREAATAILELVTARARRHLDDRQESSAPRDLQRWDGVAETGDLVEVGARRLRSDATLRATRSDSDADASTAVTGPSLTLPIAARRRRLALSGAARRARADQAGGRTS